MNRRQKIIVSITGIFLVLLILVGLTYGYFLTRIQGNTNPKSISLTTANLLLVYGDGNPEVIEKENITPGMTVGSKTFTVTNEGDSETEYVVVLDNVNITTKEGSTTTFNSNDFVYELTCSGTITSECNGIQEESVLPLTNDGVLIGNKIAKDEIQTYNLTVKYKETGIDQSLDMGKKLEARVNIQNIKDINPYDNDTSSLAYNIINNAKLNKNGTQLKMTPETKPLEEISTENERELSITTDDYGTSYYYRGNVEDNYVNFAGMCWRIVRIQGDGSIKLVLAAEKECSSTNLTTSSGFATDGAKGTLGNIIETYYGAKYVGMNSLMDYVHNGGNLTRGARNKLNSWLKTKIGEKGNPDYDKLKEENWCIGDLTNAYDPSGTGYVVGNVPQYLDRDLSFYYTAANRYYALKTPKLKCETTGIDGEIDKNKIGMLTMDEVAFAGGNGSANSNYYLNKNVSEYYWWWTISPDYYSYGFDIAFWVGSSGGIGEFPVTEEEGVLCPVVSLLPGTTISSGDGTISSPYVIE